VLALKLGLKSLSTGKENNMSNTRSQRAPRLWRNTFFCGTALTGAILGVAFWNQSTSTHSLMPPLRAELTNSVNAPEFPAGFAWHNVEKPLSIRGLRGKVVLLDFWTYGCINCIHILPDLKKLERKYPNNLVVIGVHSAKFENESDAANIRNALLRYNIEHPVVVDQKMRLWNEYTVNAWPSFVLIDPAGKVVGSVAGEGNYEILDQTISELVQKFRATGGLNETPLKLALEAAKTSPTPLWYPGKVLADEANKKLFIADSNHNRILITDWNGNVEAVAGSGVAGTQDGSFGDATFNNPQGMALQRARNGDLTLLVADTNNHMIRSLDLKRGIVSTLAGTGKQAAWRRGGGIGTRAALASPWDLQLVGSTLYVAMAGPHQIWDMDLNTKRIGPFAGSGREARLDGTLQTAALAQPSGLTTDGKSLFFADSESSSVRAVDLPGNGTRVRTLAGGDPNSGDLFTFGDKDGDSQSTLLQHPLGVAFHNGKVFVADTYNHKIKVIDLQSGRTSTWVGGGRGDKDGAQAQFYEPGGLSIAGGKLFVADTNNHKIKVVDLATKSTSTLQLKGVPAALAAEPERPVRPSDAEAGTIRVQPVVLAPNTQGELLLDVKLPAAHHLNEDSPQRVQVRVEGSGANLSKTLVKDKELQLPLRVPLKTGAVGSKGSIVLSASIFYCTDQAGLCKFKTLRFRAPFEVREGGSQVVKLQTQL
jgi:thiol-disulfide isomerase/thioredoxin